MLTEIMDEWNPWWRLRKVPEVLTKLNRSIDPLIFKAVSIKEILILVGIRRAGKTTVMYQLIDRLLEEVEPEQVLYLNFDDAVLRKQDLKGIYDAYRQSVNPQKKAFFFLDEIQNIPEWERFIKKYYDMAADVKFIVSGSSSSLLVGEYATLLTGRNLTFRIYPLSFREFLEFDNMRSDEINGISRNSAINLLDKYLELGGFPEVHFKEAALRRSLIEQYFNDIMYKDVILRHKVVPKKVIDVAVYLLTNVSKPFTARGIRAFTGLATDSIQEYVAYLEDAFLITVVSHFSYSLKEMMHTQLPKKVYCSDNGLSSIVGVRFSADYGRLAENAVCIRLCRDKKIPYYWRGKGEVDFVVMEPDTSLTAINVTYGDVVEPREAAALDEFRQKFGSRVKRMIVLTKDVEKEEGGIRFIPLWKWLLE